MLDTVRDKLRDIYNEYCGRYNSILELFIEQFEEQFVDSNIMPFEELVEILNAKTLYNLVDRACGTNNYGHYNIEGREDLEEGKLKPFLEYVPDLGILDYLKPTIRDILDPTFHKSIIVYFPKVKVTNEYDKFIYIQDLYAKVKVNYNGTLCDTFSLARATYPYKQFKVGYAHSHLPRVDSSNAGSWYHPCTGRGPINNTMDSIRDFYNEQLWGLFTFELAKYVTIESIAGTPYIRLEEVGRGDVEESMSNFYSQARPNMVEYIKHLFDTFAKYYASNYKFKFKFVGGQYHIGESPTALIINLSNAFIEFLNNYSEIAIVPTLRELMWLEILQKYIVANGKIYKMDTGNRSIEAAVNANGRHLFDFKGREVKLNILINANVQENSSLLLTKDFCQYLVTNILNIINYHYGKKQNQTNQISSSSHRSQTNQTQAGASEKPYFI